MSQNDLVIANQSFPATRSDINSALQALGSLSSGSSAPATTYANMLWYDTSNNTLKMRSEANDQWISIGYLDQTADAFRIFDDTQVVNSSGTQTGLIGDQATSAWEAGTSTTESLVSPAKVKAAVDAFAGWYYESAQTSYTNGSKLTFTHNLGVNSPIMQFDFVCTVANNGYSVGDAITISPFNPTSNRGFLVVHVDSNTKDVIFGSGRQSAFNKSTFVEFFLDQTQWQVVMRARR